MLANSIYACLHAVPLPPFDVGCAVSTVSLWPTNSAQLASLDVAMVSQSVCVPHPVVLHAATGSKITHVHHHTVPRAWGHLCARCIVCPLAALCACSRLHTCGTTSMAHSMRHAGNLHLCIHPRCPAASTIICFMFHPSTPTCTNGLAPCHMVAPCQRCILCAAHTLALSCCNSH